MDAQHGFNHLGRFSNKQIYLLLGFSVIFAIKMKCHNSNSDPTRVDFRDLK